MGYIRAPMTRGRAPVAFIQYLSTDDAKAAAHWQLNALSRIRWPRGHRPLPGAYKRARSLLADLGPIRVSVKRSV